MLRRPRRLSVLLAAGLLLVLAACGDSSDTVNRNDYRTVYADAMRAVAARDLTALWPLLTVNAQQGVEGELRSFQKMLGGGGEGGELLLQHVRERLPDVTDERITLAARGTIQDAWELLLEADPRPAKPKSAGMEIAPDGRSVRMLYAGPDGTIREVRLVQRPSGWYVDLLQL